MRKVERWHVFWNGRNKFYRLDLYSGYTGRKYILSISLSGQLKKVRHIKDMAILLYLIILSITPNDRMTQLSNIPCGGNHHS